MDKYTRERRISWNRRGSPTKFNRTANSRLEEDNRRAPKLCERVGWKSIVRVGGYKGLQRWWINLGRAEDGPGIARDTQLTSIEQQTLDLKKTTEVAQKFTEAAQLTSIQRQTLDSKKTVDVAASAPTEHRLNLGACKRHRVAYLRAGWMEGIIQLPAVSSCHTGSSVHSSQARTQPPPPLPTHTHTTTISQTSGCSFSEDAEHETHPFPLTT
ncbi:hypothetical protein RRG08_052472 [Elysia crispata]|uniref:Uncharacterized protein n=1 Tax=Elysia crispata TaxID=231223 RepID=A0AAE1B198_9GAST|nr:hypothetical protein RRG08_052472 [Elysia crispata]